MIAIMVTLVAGLCWAQNPNQQSPASPLRQVVQLNQQKADLALQGLHSATPEVASRSSDVANNCNQCVALLDQLGYKSTLNPPGQLSNRQWDQRTGHNTG
ncbi:MAG: hypothetical protein ACYCW6_32535, partial [Candidatus Xenobia bacterium]